MTKNRPKILAIAPKTGLFPATLAERIDALGHNHPKPDRFDLDEDAVDEFVRLAFEHRVMLHDVKARELFRLEVVRGNATVWGVPVNVRP